MIIHLFLRISDTAQRRVQKEEDVMVRSPPIGFGVDNLPFDGNSESIQMLYSLFLIVKYFTTYVKSFERVGITKFSPPV